jgi:hypothetical protein
MRPVLHAAAGEHTHNYFWSFLHGAHASGLKQADVILRYRSAVANWPKLLLPISKKGPGQSGGGQIYNCNLHKKRGKGAKLFKGFPSKASIFS